MPVISIKVPSFDADDFQKRVRTVLNRRGRRNENLLLRTTQYFDTVKPRFTSEIQRDGDDWNVLTGPIDDEFGQIWGYLDQGTEVRFAWMTEGYVAGTTPGTFETTPSVGQRARLTPQQPTEGIDARGWTELLAEQEQPVFENEMVTAVKKWLKSFSDKASKLISGQ